MLLKFSRVIRYLVDLFCLFLQDLARRFALSVGVDTAKSQARECVVTLHRLVF